MKYLEVLEPFRRSDLELVIWKEGRIPGNIAGDIKMDNGRSIRFSVQWYGDEYPFVVLSAENYKRPTDLEVARFFSFTGLEIVREYRWKKKPFCRNFEIKRGE